LKIFRFFQIWHPRCGPGPGTEIGGGSVLNGGGSHVVVGGGGVSTSNGHHTDTEFDRMSNSAMSELQVVESVFARLAEFFSFGFFYSLSTFKITFCSYC
jgi:hypothetical protein